MNHEDCPKMLGSLSEYMDAEAQEKLCAEIQRHMGGCGRCRVVIDTMAKTVSLYHRLPEPALPDKARERLYKVLRLTDFL